MKFGYARVSTLDQKLDLQVDALNRFGCEKIFTDNVSGAKTQRPGLDELFKYLRPGDTLVVWKLDRLGRTMRHLIDLVEDLNKREISFICLQDNIDTSTSGGKLIFHIFGALAEFERNLIRERTHAGLQAARARGRIGGRRMRLDKKQIERMKEIYNAKKNTIPEIEKMFGISYQTIYNYLRQDKYSSDGENNELHK